MSQLKLWEQVHAEHSTICDFFEFLEQHGLIVTIEPGHGVTMRLDDLRYDRLADLYLGVDRVRLEKERRALLSGEVAS